MIGIEWAFGMVTHRWWLAKRWEYERNQDWEATLRVLRG